MQIIVKRHVIDQYRNKTFNGPLRTDDDICQLVKRIIIKGTCIGRRPGKNTYKIKYQGLAVIARYYKDKIVVITFLGDEKYQRWYTNQEVRTRRKVG